jgi:hypothetical protein
VRKPAGGDAGATLNTYPVLSAEGAGEVSFQMLFVALTSCLQDLKKKLLTTGLLAPVLLP